MLYYCEENTIQIPLLYQNPAENNSNPHHICAKLEKSRNFLFDNYTHGHNCLHIHINSFHGYCSLISDLLII